MQQFLVCVSRKNLWW